MRSNFSDIKINTTVSVLVHGGNPLGFKLAKTLLEQGGRVIIVDNFNARSRSVVSDLKKIGSADFIDFSGIESLFKTIKRIDYIYYMLSEYLIRQENFSSRDFLEESNYLNQTLKSALKNDAKISLITSVKLNELLSAHILNSNFSAPSPYSAIELQKYCETLTAEYRDKSKMNARIIRLGTLLGADIEDITDPVINEMIDESSNKGFITIEGEGLGIHYIVNIEDAIYGILKLTFHSKTEGEVITLANSNDYTTLSLAYKLLEINDEISDIKFIQSKKNEKYISYDNYVPAPNASNFGWKQSQTLEQTLISTIEKLHPKTGQIIKKKIDTPKKSEDEIQEVVKVKSVKTPLGNFIETIAKPFSRITRSSSNSIEAFKRDLTPQKAASLSIVTFLILLLTYFIIYPVMTIALGGYLTFNSLKSAKTHAAEFEMDSTQKDLEKASGYIDKISTSFGQMRWIFTISGASDTYENATQLIFASEYGIKGAREVAQAVEPLSQYIQNFEPALNFQASLPSSSREYREYLTSLKENKTLLQKGVYNLNIASDLIGSVKTNTFPKPIQNYVLKLKQYNDELSKQILPMEKVVTFLPDILGIDGRVRYLILLQNPDELRSTGGWLSSYALISFEGGQIRELKVDDIYNLDGSLTNEKIEVPTSLPMRRALGVDIQTFSLSNWEPDLQSVTALNEILINKTDPGTEIDGTIAIDTELLKNLLTVWGEVIIPGETKPITAENLDERIFNLHKQFTPGESLKTPFLANLANTILQKVLTASTQEYAKIGGVLLDSLESKSTSIYLKNKEAFEYLNENGWSGTLKESYKSAPFSIEWNWGANKVNSKIERSINLNVDILNTETIDYTYALAIKNSATSKVYPLGDYTNYLRVYLPENAQIKSVKGFTDTDYQIYLENGFKIVGGWMNVPIQASKSFEIKYTLNEESSYKPIAVNNEDIEFNLSLYKQPGTKDSTLSVNVTYPDSWATVSNGGLDNVLNQLITQTKLDLDYNYSIIWNTK
ncbi:DUF4012 domain-containing protein [Candidatus Dojkabacteria bacterium]|nr:DUF4012 domain-containing protein [Candidatus Dojkabacteria bacterium]